MRAGKQLGLLACAAIFLGSGAVLAQPAAADYPNKPVRWIVTFPPGAANDNVARTIGQQLSKSLGQQFVVDNRPGASGMIGTETVAKADPDGYTLLLANASTFSFVLTRKNPPFRTTDFAPVAKFGYAPLIIVAGSSFPPKNVKELVAYAKENPGKLTWGSSGIGSVLHIGLAQFQAETGIDVVHVPYKGGAPLLVDLVGGQINLTHSSTLSTEAYVKSGRIKVLAIAGPKRQAVLPGVPTLAEQGIKGSDSSVWYGLVAPARTPRPIIDKLNREVNKALEVPDVRQRFDRLGLQIEEGGSPEKFDAFIKSELEILGRLIKTGAMPRGE